MRPYNTKKDKGLAYLFKSLALQFIVWSLVACSTSSQREILLTPYDPSTRQFATCDAAPWRLILERAIEEASGLAPEAKIYAVKASARSNTVGYTSEFIVAFEFKGRRQTISNQTTQDKEEAFTILVPECTLDATRIEYTANIEADSSSLSVDTLSLIRFSPRDVYFATQQDAEQWLGRSIEPQDISLITLFLEQNPSDEAYGLPEWGILYSDANSNRDLVFLVDGQTSNIVERIGSFRQSGSGYGKLQGCHNQEVEWDATI